MSAMGHLLHFGRPAKSPPAPIADMLRSVAMCQQATSARALSFDQLVGAEQEISTDRQAERFRRLEINGKLKFGRLLNR
jgi:hypothetical protein